MNDLSQSSEREELIATLMWVGSAIEYALNESVEPKGRDRVLLSALNITRTALAKAEAASIKQLKNVVRPLRAVK